MENNSQEIVEVEVISSDLAFQQDKALIDTQIATAKTYPRNLTRCINNVIALVTMDKETAGTCNYSLPRAGKAVSGPSVHLAKILAQNWGNMRVDAKVVSIDAKQITSQAVAFDLENNLAIRVEVKRSIVNRDGKKFNDDMVTMTGNAANAIALRNAILAVIPRAVVDKAYNAAKQTITGDVSDKTKLIARRKQVFDGLKDTYNVTEKEALSAIGKAALDHVTADDLMVLIGIGQAIKDGDTTVEQAFKEQSIKSEKSASQADKIKKATEEKPKSVLIDIEWLREKLDEVRDRLPVGDLKEANRVINGNITDQFANLKDILEAV